MCTAPFVVDHFIRTQHEFLGNRLYDKPSRLVYDQRARQRYDQVNVPHLDPQSRLDLVESERKPHQTESADYHNEKGEQDDADVDQRLDDPPPETRQPAGQHIYPEM